MTGHAIKGLPPPPPSGQPSPVDALPMRILAAMVNPVGPAPERETITVLNASPAAIDLTGSRIAQDAA